MKYFCNSCGWRFEAGPEYDENGLSNYILCPNCGGGCTYPDTPDGSAQSLKDQMEQEFGCRLPASISKYDYDELAEKALAFNATQEDINALGAWFEQYGQMFWNGESYEIDSFHRLWPIAEEVEEDVWEDVGYEIR